MPRIKEKILKNCLNNEYENFYKTITTFHTPLWANHNKIPLCVLQFDRGVKLRPLFHKIFMIHLFTIPVVFGLFSMNYALCSETIKEDILTALEQKYSGNSFQTDFTQTSNLAALDITEKASGRAFFSHPGKMKWQYLAPQQHEIITNGILLWIYRPEENQVMLGEASQFFKSGAGGAFLSDISLIRKNFHINLKEVNAEYVEIDLTAKKKSDISSIIIRISQKNSDIVRVVTYNTFDDTSVFKFTNIHFKSIDPEIFNFKVPDNMDVIEMNE
jgi:outer membrane lipoprotein carrier protein